MGKKIAIIGDLHFQGKDRYEMGWQLTLQECEKRNVEKILQLGDVFNYYNIARREETVGNIVFAVLRHLLEWLSKDEKREAIIIAGNHDIAGPRRRDALTVLENLSQITIIRKPQVIEKKGIVIAAIPWITKAHLRAKHKDLKPAEFEQLYQETIQKIINYLRLEVQDREGYKILIAHCEMEGVEVNQGFHLTGGHFQLTRTQLESIGVDKIALGHIHKRQGYYVGALLQQDFSEEGNPQGFEVVDIETGETEYVEIDIPLHATFRMEEYLQNPQAAEGKIIRIKGPAEL